MELQADYLLCRILGKTPSEVSKLDPIDIGFMKAGIFWELEKSADRGPLWLM